MARGLDLYKKIQSMNVSPSSQSSQIDNQTVSYKPGAGDSFLNEIEKKQGLLKETSPVNNRNISPIPGEKGLDRVAKFLLLLGKEEAAKVLKNLSEDEVEAICSHIAQVKRVDSVEAHLILEEFGFLKTIKPDRSTGGIGTARSILQEAFGVEKARELLERAVPKSRPVPFSFLSDVELPQLLNLVKDESPMILSVLLSSLPPEKSSQIIKALDKKMRTTVLLRMGRMEKIDPKVITLMEQTLMDRLNKQGKMETIEIDGKQKLASILKFLPLSDEKQILEDLALKNEALSEEVREQLLTIDAVLHMTDDDLQKVLQDFTEKDLAQLLRGKDEEIQSRILNNLSSRRRQFVLEESELMGPIRRKDSDNITRDFLEYIKNKEEKGELIIMREEEEYID
jgi:flagellar motor switch protein FliG